MVLYLYYKASSITRIEQAYAQDELLHVGLNVLRFKVLGVLKGFILVFLVIEFLTVFEDS